MNDAYDELELITGNQCCGAQKTACHSRRLWLRQCHCKPVLPHCLSHHSNTSYFCLDCNTLPKVAARLGQRLHKRKEELRLRIVKMGVVDPVWQYEREMIRMDKNHIFFD